MEDGVVIPEEIDLVDSEGVGSHLLDDVLDHLVVAGHGLADHLHLSPLAALAAGPGVTHLLSQLLDVCLDLFLRYFHCGNNQKIIKSIFTSTPHYTPALIIF